MKTAEGHLLKDDLSNYDPNSYERPSVTVDIIICTVTEGKLKVLLIKRKHPPFRDYWAIPGGFVRVELQEDLLETAHRELEEETGLRGIFMEQLKTYGNPKRDPRMRVITVAYYALIPQDRRMNIKAGDDAKEASWFAFSSLPGNLAFDHKDILSDLLERLRGKITYVPIAFNLVPQKFTWSELQEIYEAVLDRKILAPNFRRKLNELYIIKKYKAKEKSPGPGRPGRLLTYLGERDRL